MTEDGEVLSRVTFASHEQGFALELRVLEVELLHHLNELVPILIHVGQVLSRVGVRESSTNRLVDVDHRRVVRPRTDRVDVYAEIVSEIFSASGSISSLCNSLVNLERTVEEEISEG